MPILSDSPPGGHGLLSDRRGVVALQFAVVIGAMALLMVAALDLIRVHLIRSSMWSAVDSAILAAGRSLGSANWQQVGIDYFNANMATQLGQTTTITANDFKVTGNLLTGQSVELTVNAQVPLLSRALGNIASMNAGATARAQRKSLNVELAMVLDNTGSMSTNDNIGALRTDAANLVQVLSGGQTAGTFAYSKVALVPYSAAVNPGSAAPALVDDATAQISYGKTRTVYDRRGNASTQTYDDVTGWKGCVIERGGTNTIADTSPDVAKWQVYKWTSHTDNNYTDGNASTIRADYSYGNSSTGPNVGCPSPITPLTNDIGTVITGINAMRAWSRGGTLSDIGMAWGLRVLSPTPPFTEGVAYTNTKIAKAVVLMTDGETQFYKLTGYNNPNDVANDVNSDYTGYGRLDQYNRVGTTDKTAAKTWINNNLATLCTTMKGLGIQVYTITFGGLDSNTTNLYKTCASAADNYFDAPNVTALNNAFQSIGGSLSELTLTR